MRLTQHRWPPWLDWVVVALLAGIAITAAPWSGMISDGVRDLSQAFDIASGQAWPLLGPWMSGVGHALGPVWFYWLAVPLSLGTSWLGVVVFNGVFAALAYPVAYCCGRAWGGRGCGLVCAALLAWPSWLHINQIFLSHTDLIAVLTLSTCWALKLWLDRPSFRMALLTGLSAGLAFHAHPSTAGLVLLIAVTCAVGATTWPRFVRYALAFAFGFLAPWLPRTFAPQGDQTINLIEFFARVDPVAPLSVLPQTLWGASGRGVQVVIADLWQWPAAIAVLVSVLGIVLAVVGAISFIRMFQRADNTEQLEPAGASPHPRMASARSRQTTLLLLTAWIVTLLTAMILKQPLTFYAVFCWIAISALFVGWLLTRTITPVAPPLRWVVIIVGLGSQLLTTTSIVTTAREGSFAISPAVSDVTTGPLQPATASWYFSALDYSAVGDWACQQQNDSILLGALAAMVDISGGLESTMQCNASGRLALSGPGQAYAGFPRQWAQTQGLRVESHVGNLALVKPRRRFGLYEQRVELHDRHRYPPFVDMATNETLTVQIELIADESLIIANPRHHFLPTARWQVSGDDILTTVSERRVSVHRCLTPRCSVVVQIDAPQPALIQVFSVEHSP